MKRIIALIFGSFLLASCGGKSEFGTIATKQLAIDPTESSDEPNCSGDTCFTFITLPGDQEETGAEIPGEIPAVEPPEVEPPVIVITDPGTQQTCVKGKRLALWLDFDGDGIEDQYGGTITAYKGSKSAQDNYNYYSASAHPLVGPDPEGFKSKIFFYEDGKGGLALNLIHNIDKIEGDANYSGSADNQVQWQIVTSGNDRKDSVLLSDDQGELKRAEYRQKQDIPYDSNFYQGNWHYWNNTDGGVIGNFYGESFRINVQAKVSGDNLEAVFYSATGSKIKLMKDKKISSFVITYEKYEDCGTGDDVVYCNPGTQGTEPSPIEPILEPLDPQTPIEEPIQEIEEENLEEASISNCNEEKKYLYLRRLDHEGKPIVKLDKQGKDVSEKFGPILPYQGKLSAKDNYAYKSVSAHTIVGPTPTEYQSQFYFYQDPKGKIYFNIVHHKDESPTDPNIVSLFVEVSGNDKKDYVPHSDDNGELRRILLFDLANKSKSLYKGHWGYSENTDGGIIGPLAHKENFKLKLKAVKSGDIKEAYVYSSDGSKFPVMGKNVIDSFSIQYESACK
ncbi:MAG: hypothetical protein H6620_10385 [Halobacteriovoraceae bacterium]|nr:hypothetical protein [Halobacteriovoraceae bacterium]